MSAGLWIGTLASAGGVRGDFESIATVTVGSGGASSIEFTSIPGTYQHLQLRYLGRTTESGGAYGYAEISVNSGTNHSAWHVLSGGGSSASAQGYTNLTWLGHFVTGGGVAASTFGAGVIDFLDYASTTKTKTLRSLNGYDRNGVTPHAGYIALTSSLFNTTTAISSVKLTARTSAGGATNFAQYTTAALYGIKAP